MQKNLHTIIPNVERFGEFIPARDNHVYVSMPELNVNAEQNFIGTVIDSQT